MRRLILPVLVSLLVAAPSSARAQVEGFLDAYAGGTFTSDATVRVSGDGAPRTTGTLSFDDSPTAGVRGGLWALSFIGLGLDVFAFRPDVDAPPLATPAGVFDPRLSVTVLGIGLDAMLRLPLGRSAAFPQGRVNPYVTTGPAVFVSYIEPRGRGGAAVATPGVKAGAGIKAWITPRFALFGEYRFTQFKPEAEVVSRGVTFDVETRVKSHHAVAGASLRF